jgi:uncharacterized protein YdaU (DUF1376 family)
MADAWFSFYPGDYIRDTGDLSLSQNGAYMKLLFFYYATGRPLTSDQQALYRVAGTQDEAERAAVDFIMSRFFVLRDGVYHQDRADRELARRNELHQRLSNAGRKRWQKPSSNQAVSRAIASPQPQPQPQPKEEKERTTAPASPSPSVFAGQHFSVTQRQDALLGSAFPWVERQAEYRRADSWLEANPERRPKSNKNRFLHNWFSRIPQTKGTAPGRKLSGSDLFKHNLKVLGFTG